MVVPEREVPTMKIIPLAAIRVFSVKLIVSFQNNVFFRLLTTIISTFSNISNTTFWEFYEWRILLALARVWNYHPTQEENHNPILS